MQDQLTDRYFGISHALVAHTVTTDLRERGAAVHSLLERLPTQT